MDLLNLFKNYLFSQADKPSKVTVKNYLSDINHFVRWYETFFNKNFEPKEISSQTLNDYQTNCETVFSQSSLDRHFSTLRKFFKFLLIEGVISLDPFSVKKLNLEASKDPWHVKEFKDFLYVGDASRLTIKNYLIDIKQFLTWAAQVTESENVLSAIDSDLVEEYKERLLNQGDFSPATINRKLSSLRKYLAWAQIRGIIGQIQDSGFKNLELDRSEIRNEKVELESLRSRDQEILTQDQVVPTSNFKYSRFAPFRLVQKISEGFIFALDNGLVIHLAKIVDRAEYTLWKTQGQPVFTKINDLKTKAKIRQSAPAVSHSILSVKNIKKEFYAPLEISTKLFPWYKKAWFTARYSRPKWYKTYHSYPIAHYLNFAVLIIFLGVISFSFYNVFFQKGNQSPTLAAGGTTPVAPPRVLSFQGRLTDNNDNPITAVTNLRFMIYNDSDPSSTASSRLWEEVDNVKPDTDGIFNVILGNGSACNSGNPPSSPATAACAIPQSLFANNAALWLGVTVGATPELTPRQQLATVAYATNAETLQGLVPTTSGPTAYTNTVLALDGTTTSPTLTIGGAVGTTFQATGGQFQILGKSLLLGSTSGSGGNVQVAPDGLGFIDLQRPLINSANTSNIAGALGAVEVDDMFGVLATSSGAAVTIQQNGTGDLLTASAGANTKFRLTNSGQFIAPYYNTAGCTLKSDTSGNITCGSAAGPQFWQELSGALSPTQLGDDFLLGSSSTSTAKFSLTGLMGTQTQASLSGQLIVVPNNGYGGGIQLGSTVNSNNVLNTISQAGNPSGNLYWGNRQLVDSNNIGSFGVSSVSNSDGTLNITPTTGAVIASLNLSHINSWSGAQTFTANTNLPGNGIWNTSGNVGIGDITPASALTVGNGDLFQVNSSGAIVAATGITSSGTITLSGFTGANNGGLVFANSSGVLSQTGAGVAGQCLTGGTTPTWNSCSTAAGGSFWQDINGAISPLTSSDDLLLGSSSTSSAIFAFTGLKGNQTQASMSGQFILTPNLGYGGSASISGNLTLGSYGLTGAIQTTSNQLLTIGGNTTGDIKFMPGNLTSSLYLASSGNVGVGTISPLGILNVNGGYGSNAALIVNQLNSGELFTASASGATKFTISNSGAITSQAYLNAGGILYTSTSGLIGQTGIGTSVQCLIGGTTPTWSSCSQASSNFWQELTGALSPVTSSDDLLLGGSSTASAKFAFTGLMGSQTQASLSGSLVVTPDNGYGGSASISGNLTLGSYGLTGAIQTTNNQLLTIGGNTTGDITLSPNNGSSGRINLNAPTINTNATTLALFNTTATTLNLAGAATTVNMGAPTGSASLSATLTLGGSTNSTINPGNGTLNFGYKSGANTWATAMTILDNTGSIGIATITPTAALDVAGTASVGGVLKFRSGTAQVQATADQNLILGGDTTGLITLKGFNGAIGGIALSGYNTCTLKTDASGNIACGTDLTSATSLWQELTGALSPTQSGDDLLIGSSSTSSAVFAFTGLMNNTASGNHQTQASFSGQFIVTPNVGYGGNASISGNLTLGSYGLTGAIQTTNNQLLIIGGNTTGNITLSPNNGSSGILNLNAATINTNATTLALFNTTATTLNLAGAATSLNMGAPTGSASISATLVLGGTSGSTIEPGNGALKFGYKSGLNAWSTAMTILDNTGNVGIGTTNPLATLDVRGNSATSAIASFSGSTNFAGLLVSNAGSGDLITASSGATLSTQFKVSNAGGVYGKAWYDLDNPTNYYMDLSSSGTSLIAGGNVGIGLAPGITPATALDIRSIVAGTSTIASISGNLIVMPNGGWGGQVGIGTTSPTAGQLQISNANDVNQLVIDKPAGHYGQVVFTTSGTARWNLITNNTAESGSNVGSDFQVNTYADNGTFLSTPLFMKRSTGYVGIGTTSPGAVLQLQSPAGGAYSPVLAIREGANPTYGFTFKQDDLTTGDLELDRVNANVSTAMMTFQRNTGNVGINTTTPSYPLDIEAAGNSTATIYANGNSNTSWVGTATIFGNASQGFIGGQVSSTYWVGVGGYSSQSNGVGVYGSAPNNRDFMGSHGEYTNGAAWTNGSSRVLKENFTNLDSQAILGKILQLPITEWNYISAPGDNFIGPMAEDFSSVFKLGDTTGIDTVSPAAIALIGVKALNDNIASLSANLAPITLTNTGDLALNDQNTSDINFTIPHYFTLNDALGNPLNGVGAFAEASIANLKAGGISAQQITTNALSVVSENVTINGQNIHDYIASIVTSIVNSTNNNVISPITTADEISTGFISPIDSSANIGLKLDNNKLSVLNTNSASGSAVAVIDNQGNASFSGQLTSNSLNTNDATISGTLHVGKVIADEIVGATTSATYITNVTNIYNSTPSSNFGLVTNTVTAGTTSGTFGQQSTNGYIDISSYSGILTYVDNLSAANAAFNQNLTVFGQTSLSDTSIIGQLSVGGNLILANDSINVLGSDLNLQPLREGGLSIMGGLFYIDTDGNIKAGGDADFAKNITVHGNLATNIISPLPGNDLNLNTGNSSLKVTNASSAAVLSVNSLGDLIASGAGTFSKLNLGLIQPAFAVSPTEVIATGSAGVVTLKANQTNVTVQNPMVTEHSLIYITPAGETAGQNLFLQQQVPNNPLSGTQGSFTVGTGTTLTTDIKFNFLIIN
jgi:site-specific recombinase XerD